MNHAALFHLEPLTLTTQYFAFEKLFYDRNACEWCLQLSAGHQHRKILTSELGPTPFCQILYLARRLLGLCQGKLCICFLINSGGTLDTETLDIAFTSHDYQHTLLEISQNNTLIWQGYVNTTMLTQSAIQTVMDVYHNIGIFGFIRDSFDEQFPIDDFFELYTHLFGCADELKKSVETQIEYYRNIRLQQNEQYHIEQPLEQHDKDHSSHHFAVAFTLMPIVLNGVTLYKRQFSLHLNQQTFEFEMADEEDPLTDLITLAIKIVEKRFHQPIDLDYPELGWRLHIEPNQENQTLGRQTLRLTIDDFPNEKMEKPQIYWQGEISALTLIKSIYHTAEKQYKAWKSDWYLSDYFTANANFPFPIEEYFSLYLHAQIFP